MSASRAELIFLQAMIALGTMGAAASAATSPSAAPPTGSPPVVHVSAPSDAVSHSAIGDEPLRGASGDSSLNSAPAAKTTEGAGGMDYPRVMAALGIVIGLIFALRWCGRLFFPASTGRGASRAVEVLTRAPLSAKQQVMLIRVGRRLIVVGDSGAQMNALCEIRDADEVAALVGQLRDEKSSCASKAFAGFFKRSRRGFESLDEPAAEPAPPLQEPEQDEPAVTTAREELCGLRERVRLLAEQFKG